MRGFKSVFVSALRESLSGYFGCKSKEETQLKDKLIISLKS